MCASCLRLAQTAYDELKNICVWAKTTPGPGSFYVVLSENHIRTYWWCNPVEIGMATMTPDRSTARPRGASLPNAKCVRI